MTQVAQLYATPNPTLADPLALLVGMSRSELPRGHGLWSGLQSESLPYILLHAALARAPWADYVVSPLVSEHFDALDLALELDRAGYTGRYVVIAPKVPRPDIIRREIRQIAPRLTVEVITRCFN